jgi:3-methyladenine DNA glycosylase/8-oxoguanine DNA glycosylase
VPTARITLNPRGDFSLSASIRFLTGFGPLSYDDDLRQTLRLAFAVDGDWRPAGVSVQQTDSGSVSVAIGGDADSAAVAEQVERMLSLDVDASTLEQTLPPDPVASGLLREFSGLRPVCFASPYEAAAWAVISQRVQMKQAAKVRMRMCEGLGHELDVAGRTMHTFPDPETLRVTSSIEGLNERKIERLHGVADAALDGRLDAAALRAAGPDRALEDVQEIPGIGPFSADLIVIRGAGEPDHFSRTERRLHAAMASAYGVDARDVDALEAIAATWRPFRSWIGFLFRNRLSAAPPARG